MKYGYKKQLDVSFEEAIKQTKAELAHAGFGVLTEIDVQATLKTKLDVDYDKYVILGACNPSFAHQALMAEKDVGLLLPCNVIVYEDDGKVFVSAVMPTVAMSAVENSAVEPIAREVEEMLRKVVDSL
jgi:uncharacterized protein (DUF302 family)